MAKISVNVWDSFSDTEKELFKRFCSKYDNNSIKRFFKAITAKFGSVDNVSVKRFSVVESNGDFYWWSDLTNSWYQFQPKTPDFY